MTSTKSAERDGIHVHEEKVGAELTFKPIMDAAGKARAVIAPVADEHLTRHGPSHPDKLSGSRPPEWLCFQCCQACHPRAAGPSFRAGRGDRRGRRTSNTRLHLASFKAASCSLRSWSSVEMPSKMYMNASCVSSPPAADLARSNAALKRSFIGPPRWRYTPTERAQ